MIWRALYTASLGAVLVCIFPLAGCRSRVEGPSVYVEHPDFDAGVVTTDDLLDHVFVVENRGNEPLVLHSVKTSCGCSAAVMHHDEISPGKRGHVQVSLHPDGSAGRKIATAVVVTNDPAQANVLLRLRCDFRPELYAQPKKVQLGSFPGEELSVAKGAVDIISGSGLTEFEIASVDTTSAAGMVASVETVREGIHYRISVRNDLPIQPGGYNGTLVVRTNNRKCPELTIPVVGKAVGPVEVQPPAVFLDQASADETRQDYILRIVPGTVKDFRVVKVSAPSGATVRIEVKERHTVVYLVDMPGNCAIDGSNVTIETNIDGMAPLRVPIVVRGCEPN